MLHHDNGSPHVWLLISEPLAQQEMTLVPHPPYSPDLAPQDYRFFLEGGGGSEAETHPEASLISNEKDISRKEILEKERN